MIIHLTKKELRLISWLDVRLRSMVGSCYADILNYNQLLNAKLKQSKGKELKLPHTTFEAWLKLTDTLVYSIPLVIKYHPDKVKECFALLDNLKVIGEQKPKHHYD